MSICINPENRRIRVNLDHGHLIFGVRSPSAPEWFTYKKTRLGNFNSRRGKMEINSDMEVKAVEFIETLMVSVEAFNDKGQAEDLTYRDPEDGQEKPLSASVPKWTRYVPESIKFQLATMMEYVDAEMEGETEKN